MAMQSVVVVEFEGKSLGLQPALITKNTISTYFGVQSNGLHLKIWRNGKHESIWAHTSGHFFVPTGTTRAEIIAFGFEDDQQNVAGSSRYITVSNLSV